MTDQPISRRAILAAPFVSVGAAVTKCESEPVKEESSPVASYRRSIGLNGDDPELVESIRYRGTDAIYGGMDVLMGIAKETKPGFRGKVVFSIDVIEDEDGK